MSDNRYGLVAKQIVNKNGVETTVHVRPDDVVQLSGTLRMVGVPTSSVSSTRGGPQRETEIRQLGETFQVQGRNATNANRLAVSGWKINSASLGEDTEYKIQNLLEDLEDDEKDDVDLLRANLSDNGFFLSDDDDDGQLLEDDESVEHYYPQSLGSQGRYESKGLDFTFADEDDVFDEESGPDGERTLNMDKFATFVQDSAGRKYGVTITPTKQEGGGGWPECTVEGKAHNLHRFLVAYENGDLPD